MPTQAEYQADNALFLENLMTEGREKIAAEAGGDWTRTTVREDGIFRRILPMEQVGDDRLSRSVRTNKNVIVVDREPPVPPAVVINFRARPDDWYIDTARYEVEFQRNSSPSIVVDVDELRTFVMDIRQVMQDNMAKDLMTLEDESWFSAVNDVLVAADSVLDYSGVSQWQTISGGISRVTLQEAFKVLPSTPFHLETHTVVINNVTIREIMKWHRDEVGDDYAGKLLRDGFTETDFMRARWIVSIKRETIIPDDSIYLFANENFIGKSYSLQDVTLFLERRAYMVQMNLYELIGSSIGHVGGCGRVDFN